jgi:hypothetical protein
MHPRKSTAFFAALGLALTAAQGEAQTPTAQKQQVAGPQQAAATTRPPARVTVRKRSFLEPGTETKTLDGHYQDYAFPPGDATGAGRSTLFQQNYNVNYQLRNPFPNCFDLPGYCR